MVNRRTLIGILFALSLTACGAPQLIAAWKAAAASTTSTTKIITIATSMSASPSTINANGVATATVTVTLLDSQSSPLNGKLVTLSSSRASSDTISPATGATTGTNGVATFTVKSSTAGASTYTAKDSTDSQTLTSSAAVTFLTVPGACGSSVYCASILADTPAGYWRLNEAAGTVAHDLAGSAMNGTYTAGFTLNQAPIPATQASLSLDGSTGYVTLPAGVAAILNGQTNWSVEVWGNAAALHSCTVNYFCQRHLLDFGQDAVFLAADQSAQWVLGSLISTVYQTDFSPTSYTTGTAIYMAATYDGANLILYINGVAVATQPVVGVTNGNGTLSYIGSASGSDRFWSGRLAEVALYGYTLTAAQISAHYSMGLSGP